MKRHEEWVRYLSCAILLVIIFITHPARVKAYGDISSSNMHQNNETIVALQKERDPESSERDYVEEQREAELFQEEILKKLDDTQMNALLAELFPEKRMNAKEMIGQIMSGNLKPDRHTITQVVRRELFDAFETNRKGMKHILLLALGTAFFLNVSGVFETRQASEISFFLMYLLLVSVCLTSFQSATEWVSGGIEKLIAFMKVLFPIFFVAVTVAKGSFTALGFYHLALLMILCVELLIVKVILPMIHIYVVTRILNSLQKESYLSKLAELLETLIEWTMKTVLGFMIGLNVIQGLIAPAIDGLKQQTATKGLEIIPGIGDALGGTAEIIIGTAVLIKNSIGVFGVLIFGGLCLMPLTQMGILTLSYQLIAAIIQPVSDHRIVECISGVSEGCRLLLRAVFSCAVMFLLTIAIVAYSTNMG